MRTRAALAIAALVLVPAIASAKGSLPKYSAPVVDAAGIVPDDVEQRLNSELNAYQQQTSNQVAVAVIRTTGDTSLEDYSIDLARAWGVGQKGKDNGVLLLVAYDDRRLRIEVGSGLEGDLTDLESGRIIRDVMTPKLRAGDLGGALEGGVAGIISAISGTFNPPTQPPQDTGDGLPGFAGLIPLLFVVAGFGSFIRRRGRGGRRGWGGMMLPVMLGSILSSGSGSNSGGGGFGGSDFGGGGFSGGGGGGFSGGGASGGW